MTSRSHSTARKVAARAVPAFLVAGLGLSLQAVPAVAETPTVIASDQNQEGDVATSGAVTGVDINNEQTIQHGTLQEALRKDYSYIEVNENLTESIRMTANPDYSEDEDGYYCSDRIIMNGHSLKGNDSTIPTIYNLGHLVFRNVGEREAPNGTGAISSATGSAGEPVIYNGPEGTIET